jgi:hypothetical protein
MECRKVDAPGEQVPAARRGEAWHSHDGGKGGLLRETAYPGWKLTGLEMLGWINSGLDEQYGPYVVDRADHFLFNVPEPTGLKNGDAFGLSAGGRLPGANGHEIDIRLRRSKSSAKNPPPCPCPTNPPASPRWLPAAFRGRFPARRQCTAASRSTFSCASSTARTSRAPR